VILDSSAIIAILMEEPDVDQLLEKLTSSVNVKVGGPTLTETAIVLAAKLGSDPRGLIERFLQELEVTVIPFGDLHWQESLEGYLRFGKGRHPAALNLGDSMSYAVAKVAGEPLLCIGKDFPQTDLPLA
jgi:ribonuclease VapC